MHSYHNFHRISLDFHWEFVSRLLMTQVYSEYWFCHCRLTASLCPLLPSQSFHDCVFCSAFWLTVDILPRFMPKFNAIVLDSETIIDRICHITEYPIAKEGSDYFLQFLHSSILSQLFTYLYYNTIYLTRDFSILLLWHLIESKTRQPISTYANCSSGILKVVFKIDVRRQPLRTVDALVSENYCT